MRRRGPDGQSGWGAKSESGTIVVTDVCRSFMEKWCETANRNQEAVGLRGRYTIVPVRIIEEPEKGEEE